MRNLWKGGLAILGAIAISTVGVTEALAQTVNAWSPKPTTLAPYVNGNKPWTKLSEVLAGPPNERQGRALHPISTWTQSLQLASSSPRHQGLAPAWLSRETTY